MSHAKMYLAGAVFALASLVTGGPAFATATNLLFDDGTSGTSLVISVDGSVVNTVGPETDISGTPNTFGEFVTGAFSIPSTTISILDPATSLVSDQLQISTISLGPNTLTLSAFISNDGLPLPLDIFNPITETGLTQTLLSQEDEQGNSLTIQFLSELDAPAASANSVPEPSTLALFGAALAMFGMMMRRRSAHALA